MLKTKRLLLKLLAIFGIVLILNIVNRLESRQPEEEIRESIAGVSVYNEERQLKDLLIFDYKTDRQFILTYTFPVLNSGLGAAGTFWLYGIICLAGGIFVVFCLPETKGKSLEELEKELIK